MLVRVFFSLLLLCLFLLLPTHASAAKTTAVGYDATYAIEKDGITHVSFIISLTNTESTQYATEYKTKVGFNQITNVQAKDPDGTLSPRVTKEEDGYTIALTFKKKVVGVGKTLTFTLTFDTPDIVQREGNVWEIYIPGIAESSEFTHFSSHVTVPSFLGKPIYVKPTPISEKLDFTKEQLGKGGIAIAYGTEQTYAFTTLYHLRNTNIFPTTQHIAIPPNTNYQEVAIESISPKPAD